MIPLLAHVRIRRERKLGFGLWIPLFLAWLLLAPLALLLVPIFVALCWLGEVSPWQALSTFWQILAGFRNTHIEVGHQETSILIHTF
jgi:hypothetical protein